MSVIDKLAFIEVNDRKLLVTLSRGKDTWYIPGGKREGSELDEEALMREVKEELSVDIIPESIELYGAFEAPAHGKTDGTTVKMTCYMARYNGELMPSSEIEKMDFFTWDQKKLCSAVDNLIFDDLYDKGLID